MKKFIIIAAALLAAGSAAAQNRFSFGVSTRFHAGFNERTALKLGDVKLTDSGTPDKVMSYSYLLDFDYAVTPLWTLGAVIGINDLSYDNTMPLYLEAKRFWDSDTDRSRWFTYADLGTNIAVQEGAFGLQCGLGAGYRFRLARRCKLDLTLGYNIIQSRYPETTIIDIVEVNDVTYTTADCRMLRHTFSFGIGLNF